MTQKAVLIGGVMKFVTIPSANQKFVSDSGAAPGGGPAPPPTTPYDVTVTVDKSASVGTIDTMIGASHIQHSLEYNSADPNGVARAQQLERDLAVDWNMTHMTGPTFALRSLSPSAGAAGSTYNWATSGSARGLDSGTSGVFNMFKTMNQGKAFLCCHSAESFQAPGRSANDPPTPAFFSDYANEVVNAIIRSETVGGTAAIRAVGVWNEFKGYYSAGGRTQPKIEEAADLFAAVYTAVKAHDSTILVTGPHINLGGYTNQPDRHDPLKATSFSGYDRNTLNWWLNRCQVNGKFPDALTLDYSIVDFGSGDPDIGNLTNIAAGVDRFQVIKADADALMVTAWGAAKPVWWIEQYFDVNMVRAQYQGTSPVYSQAFQAAMMGGRYCAFVNSGAKACFTWQPDSRDGFCADGWWKMTGTGTDVTTGTPYSPYTALKTLRGACPLGAARYACTSDQSYMKAIATATKVGLVNMSSTSKSVRVLSSPSGSAVVLTVPAWGVVSQVIT